MTLLTTLRNSRGKAVLWIFLFLLLLVILAAVPFLLDKPPVPPPFEITQFSGAPKVYSHEMKKWVDAERGMLLHVKDKIQTDKLSEVDMKVEGKIFARLKQDSFLENKAPKPFTKEVIQKFHLQKGDFLVALDEEFKHSEDRLEVTTPLMVNAVRGTKFHVHASQDGNYSLVAVLRGSLDASAVDKRGKPIDTVSVGTLEMAQVSRLGEIAPAERVSQDEWAIVKEAYELIPRSAAFEAEQLDLSKEAGTLYERVFDHGTFYTPKIGYAARQFKKDENTGEVFLEVEYDVFPKGSYVGVYNKTRSFDIAYYKGFSFEARRTPGENFPEWFRIEVKSRGQIIRTFAGKEFEKNWETQEFFFNASKESPVTEITFVFSNEKVGAHKKGFVQIKNLNLIEFTGEELEDRKARAKEKATGAITTFAARIKPLEGEAADPLAGLAADREPEAQPVRRQTKPAKPRNEQPQKVSFDDLPTLDF